MPETDEKKRKEVSVSASGPQKKRIKKRYKYECSADGCTNHALKKGGVCVRHGAKKKRCSSEGCPNEAVKGGVCWRHGAKRMRKRCSSEGCTNQAQKGGVCIKHGAKRKLCSSEGCSNYAVQGGVCIRHGAKVKLCSSEGCTNQAKQGGVCIRHGSKVEKFIRSVGIRCSFEGCINRVGERGGLCSNHSAHDVGSAQPNGGQRGDVEKGGGKENNESTVAVAKICDSKEGEKKPPPAGRKKNRRAKSAKRLTAELKVAKSEVTAVNVQLKETSDELEAVKSRYKSEHEENEFLLSRMDDMVAQIEDASELFEETLETEKAEMDTELSAKFGEVTEKFEADKSSWKAWWKEQKASVFTELSESETQMKELKVELKKLKAEKKKMSDELEAVKAVSFRKGQEMEIHGDDEEDAIVIEEAEQFNKAKIRQGKLRMAVQGFQMQTANQSRDRAISATAKERGNHVVFDPTVVEFEGNAFRKNKCYGLKGNDTTIVGIQRFVSTDVALCILVIGFEHTILGEAGANPMKEAYVQVFNYVKEISLSSLDEESDEVDQIPRLIYQAQTPGNWYSFGYFYDRTKVKRVGFRKQTRSLELFAGAGGSLQGYHNAGFHTVMAVENDRDSVLTLRANNEDLKVYDGCIKTFNEDFEKIALGLGRIDHIHFSSPCQDFSMANRSIANSSEENEPRERADLSLLLVDLIKKTCCDTAVFENVVGIWSRISCGYLHTITSEIIKLGYQVRCTVLHACDYGDPQRRPRFFMFIAKNNVPLPLIPSATHGNDLNQWPYVTVEDALSQVSNDDSLSKQTNLQPGQHGHIRLDGNNVAPTLRASACTPFHYSEDRLITVREAATLQSFPDWYTFQGNITSQYRQVGNAIPVRLATAVANSFRDVLIHEYGEEDSNDEELSL